jgi:hypothetical protein
LSISSVEYAGRRMIMRLRRARPGASLRPIFTRLRQDTMRLSGVIAFIGLLGCAAAAMAGPTFRPHAAFPTTAPATAPKTTLPSMTPAQNVPRPAPGSAVMHGTHRRLVLAPPTGLTETSDYATCTAHGGLGAGLACKASLPKGGMALVWSYASTKISGFHVYQVQIGSGPGGVTRTLAGSQDNGAGATIFILDGAPPGGYFQDLSGAIRCYSVTAYSGDTESDYLAGGAYCGTNHLPMQTVSLKPYWRSAGLQNIAKQPETSYNPGRQLVGYNYSTDKADGLGADSYTDDALRTGLMFDLGGLRAAHIVSARLRMEVNRTWNGSFLYAREAVSGVATDHSTSCIAKIFQAKTRWWKPEAGNDWIDEGAMVQMPGGADGPDVTFDLTKLVRSWASEEVENRGLVLEGAEENLKAFTEAGCMTEYVPDSTVLEVTYY